MSKLVSIDSSPLMRPVHYNGQTYFTGQYFHHMYRANSDADGKYKQTGTFLRLIRSIEAYPLYVENSDIVELTWDQVKNDSSNAEIASLIKTNSYKPVMLINATAQVALTHHLDDAVSKQASVNANRQVAQLTTAVQNALPVEEDQRAALTILDCQLKAAALLHVPTHIAQQESVKAVRAAVGVDYSHFLLSAPEQQAINDDDEMLEPEDLAKRLGFKDGKEMNLKIRDLGFQVRVNGDWVPTDKGKPYCVKHAWSTLFKSGYNLKWRVSVIKKALEDAA